MNVTPVSVVSLVAGLIAAGWCVVSCGQTSCTPEDHGLGDAARLAPKRLPGTTASPSACTAPRIEVIASEAELRSLYDRLGPVSEDGVTAEAGASPYPAVDFSRERVIVREGVAGQGISWAVARGATGVVGLLPCATANPLPSCIVQVVSVSALIDRVESRTCESVACGRGF